MTGDKPGRWQRQPLETSLPALPAGGGRGRAERGEETLSPGRQVKASEATCRRLKLRGPGLDPGSGRRVWQRPGRDGRGERNQVRLR